MIGNDAGELRYLIRKGGYYYRPNAQGYTSNQAEAGRYTLAEAISHSHPNGPDGPRDGMDYLLAPPSTPASAGVLVEAQAQHIARAVMTWGQPHFKHMVAFSTLCEAIEQALSTTATPASDGVMPEAIAAAIKKTEYKYFGDYEMSDDQREAVDVLVQFAQEYYTPTPDRFGEGYRAGEWQDIASAPRTDDEDQPCVLVIARGRRFVAEWDPASGYFFGTVAIDGYEAGYEHPGRLYGATHWQPFPDAIRALQPATGDEA